LARKRRKKDQRIPAAPLPPANRKTGRTAAAAASSASDRARRRATGLMKGAPSAPQQRREGDGWLVVPRNGRAVLFLARLTQFTWPTESEIAKAGKAARSASHRLLEVAANSDAEKLLFAARMDQQLPRAAKQSPRVAKNDLRSPSLALGRVNDLLCSYAIRTVPTRTRLIVLGGIDCEVGQNRAGDTVVILGGRAPISFGRTWTAFPNATDEEIEAATTAGGRYVDGVLHVSAASAAETSLFRSRITHLLDAKRQEQEEERQRKVAEHAFRERQLLSQRAQLLEAIAQLATAGARVAIDDEDLLYEGMSFGSVSLTHAYARVMACGQTIKFGEVAEKLLPILRERRQQLQAVEAVVRWLGAITEFDNKGLRVNGELASAAADPDPPDLDRVIGRRALPEFERHVTAQLGQLVNEPLDIMADSANGIVRVYSDAAPLASVTATSARVGDTLIAGPFTEPARPLRWSPVAPPWAELTQAIATRLTELEDERRRGDAAELERAQRAREAEERRRATAARRVEDEARELPAALRDECLAASENIRLNRTAAFSNRVTLITDAFELTFDPLDSSGGALSTRFEYSKGSDRITGQLRLGGLSDPLPVILYGAPDTDLAAKVWASVPLGFAALTVLPDFVAVRTPRPTYSRSRPRDPRRPVANRRDQPTRRRDLGTGTRSRRRARSCADLPLGRAERSHRAANLTPRQATIAVKAMGFLALAL
jgi:hypothetical protein